MDRIPVSKEDYERLLFFESARDKAADNYLRCPLDADNLTRWGGALLELAQFRQGQESTDMVEDALAKLEEARRIDPKKADTLWCLGNAHTSQGFLITETETAKEHFAKASQCFQQALEVDPDNELYKKAREMSGKAPALHQELQKQFSVQQSIFGTSGASMDSPPKNQNKQKSSDIKYDVLGWLALAIGVFAWIGMSKSTLQASFVSNL